MAFMNELFRYRNKYFLETGTGQGDITQRIADSGCFETIYTLEASKELYETAVKRFEDKKTIHCFNADSTRELQFLIRDITQPITFFFNTGQLEQELLQIREHPIKNHVIILKINEQVNPNTLIDVLRSTNSQFKFALHSKDSIHFLVAFVDEFQPISIHKYVKSTPFASMPPGIGDFLRGSIAMIQHAQKYNYKFFVDHSSHPIFDWLEPSEYSLFYNINTEIKYLLTWEEYNHYQIKKDLEELYKSGSSFTCCNNAFYAYDGEKPVSSPTSEHAKETMKRILVPNYKLKSVILETYKKLGILPNSNYFVIHLRCGDQSLWNKDAYAPEHVDYYSMKINLIIEKNPNLPLVLLTDSSAVGRILKERIPSLFYTDSPRIHLGALNVDHSIVPYTLAEMFIIIYAKTILSNSRSGFSDIPSQIFDIPYHPVF